MRSAAWILLFVGVLASCSEDPPTGPHPLEELQVRTDRDSYAEGEEIELTIENTTEVDAFFHECDTRIGFMVQQREGSEWVDWRGVDFMGSDGPTCPSILPSGVVSLGPGESYIGYFEVREPGTFRVEVWTGTESSEVRSHPAHSNPFDIE